MDKIDALAAVPDVDCAFLDKAVSTARKAFSGWRAVPFRRRKAIVGSLLNKIADHANELSALLTAEQGGSLAQARWEIDLLTKAFGPALMEMAVYENEEDAHDIEQITRRYVPIDSSGVITPWNWPVLLSFGKVLPALLTGDTVVLRPSPYLPLTVLRISDYVRELLPPGVFNVTAGGHDLWPLQKSHSGIDLITFTRSTNKAKRVSESTDGTPRPTTLEPRGDERRAVADTNQEKIAFFGRVALVPINRKPGRYGLARALFEVLRFQPVRTRTQVLVWSLARRASYTLPPR
jgi:acyl-CoA reductase-like NAD-dependent aldehyde dehydrogenase